MIKAKLQFGLLFKMMVRINEKIGEKRRQQHGIYENKYKRFLKSKLKVKQNKVF